MLPMPELRLAIYSLCCGAAAGGINPTPATETSQPEPSGTDWGLYFLFFVQVWTLALPLFQPNSAYC